uniref:Uncharacterized protein n=1 Tax=Molossus molossus TaxID=27622 RepID=A0A7J8GKS6_MOLMO|nr:hypothetical protein HJG59_011479 [Molossus molossus]
MSCWPKDIALSLHTSKAQHLWIPEPTPKSNTSQDCGGMNSFAFNVAFIALFFVASRDFPFFQALICFSKTFENTLYSVFHVLRIGRNACTCFVSYVTGSEPLFSFVTLSMHIITGSKFLLNKLMIVLIQTL